MAIKFKATPVKSYLDQSGNGKYIARPVKREKADFKVISDMISDRSTLSSTDIIAVLYAFSEVVPELLLDNCTVHLPPLGIFSLSFKSTVHETAAEVRAGSISEIRMQFRPDKEISRRLNAQKELKKA